MIPYLLLGAIFLFLAYHALISMVRPANFPPGPIGLPFIGSIHLIAPELAKNLKKMSKKYGNIFSLKLKGTNIVCITDFDLIKEVMVDNPKPYSGRPNLVLYELLRGTNEKGIALEQYGPRYIAHKKLFHSALRTLGLANRNFDRIIVEELPYFVDSLQNQQINNKKFDPTPSFDNAVLNVLAYYLFGNRYNYGDEKFKWLIECNNKVFSEIEKTHSAAFALVTLIPYMHKFWLPQAPKAVLQSTNEIEMFIASEIEYHKLTRDPENPRDFIDVYLHEMSTQSSHHMTERSLRKSILDFFSAGTETTTTTLKWAVLYMVNNPQIQRKVHAEIEKVLGIQSCPCYEDRVKLPYTEATILEVQRKANIAPIGVFHSTITPVKLAGYDLPVGTIIMPSYHSVHYSPKAWKNPKLFDPENFLDPDGKVGNRPAFMPFGGGLRICLGMTVAKKELFLFFVAMMQHFELLPPPGVSKLNEDYVNGGTLQPHPYQIIARSRT